MENVAHIVYLKRDKYRAAILKEKLEDLGIKLELPEEYVESERFVDKGDGTYLMDADSIILFLSEGSDESVEIRHKLDFIYHNKLDLEKIVIPIIEEPKWLDLTYRGPGYAELLTDTGKAIALKEPLETPKDYDYAAEKIRDYIVNAEERRQKIESVIGKIYAQKKRFRERTDSLVDTISYWCAMFYLDTPVDNDELRREVTIKALLSYLKDLYSRMELRCEVESPALWRDRLKAVNEVLKLALDYKFEDTDLYLISVMIEILRLAQIIRQEDIENLRLIGEEVDLDESLDLEIDSLYKKYVDLYRTQLYEQGIPGKSNDSYPEEEARIILEVPTQDLSFGDVLGEDNPYGLISARPKTRGWLHQKEDHNRPYPFKPKVPLDDRVFYAQYFNLDKDEDKKLYEFFIGLEEME